MNIFVTKSYQMHNKQIMICAQICQTARKAFNKTDSKGIMNDSLVLFMRDSRHEYDCAIELF